MARLRLVSGCLFPAARVALAGNHVFCHCKLQSLLVRAAPVSAFFKAKERIAFDIAVPQAVNLFQASEGRFPKSHEEFMEKIIKANRIELPKLPEGMTYRFHSDTGELWVHPIDEKQGVSPTAAPQQ